MHSLGGAQATVYLLLTSSQVWEGSKQMYTYYMILWCHLLYLSFDNENSKDENILPE